MLDPEPTMIVYISEECAENLIDGLNTKMYELEELPADPRVEYFGSAAEFASRERQLFDSRQHAPRQREAMIKVMAQNRGGRISR